MQPFEGEITVTAPRGYALTVAKDADLLANWSGGFYGSHLSECDEHEPGQCFSIDCTDSRKNPIHWHLAYVIPPSKNVTQEKTKITASVTRVYVGSGLMDWLYWKWLRRQPGDVAVQSSLDRLKALAEAPSQAAMKANGKGFETADLLTLLNVYTTQFGSYTTLLWQVPALGLTAQAFLLMIALTTDSSRGAKYVSAVISIIIALASAALMHDQRGRAINQAELAKRLSYRLSLREFLGGSFRVDDAVPKTVNARAVWAVNHTMYVVWRSCMLLFAVADLAIILSTGFHLGWFT
jgi:hypothetical protein